MARKSLLSDDDLKYVLRCEKIKAKVLRKIGRAALARKFNMSVSCISKYIAGHTITRDQQLGRGPQMSPKHRPIGYRP